MASFDSANAPSVTEAPFAPVSNVSPANGGSQFVSTDLTDLSTGAGETGAARQPGARGH